MRAFQVRLNGRKLCTAGTGEFGGIYLIASWTRHLYGQLGDQQMEERIDLSVSGLAETGDHLRWKDLHLAPGDQITLKLLRDTKKVDEPESVESRQDAAKILLAEKKRHVRRMAKELGWKVVKK